MSKKKSKAPAKEPKKKKQSQKKKKSAWKKLFLLILVLMLVVCGLYLFSDKDRFLTDISRYARKIVHVARNYFTETWEAVLLFGDEETDLLVREYRMLTTKGVPAHKIEALMHEIVKGPLKRGIRTTPEETVLRSVSLDEQGVVQVDFSSELIEQHPGGSSSELLTIFSIVNTVLLNVEEAKRVQIMVDGSAIDTIAGHINCRDSFPMNNELIKNF